MWPVTVCQNDEVTLCDSWLHDYLIFGNNSNWCVVNCPITSHPFSTKTCHLQSLASSLTSSVNFNGFSFLITSSWIVFKFSAFFLRITNNATNRYDEYDRIKYLPKSCILESFNLILSQTSNSTLSIKNSKNALFWNMQRYTCPIFHQTN